MSREKPSKSIVHKENVMVWVVGHIWKTQDGQKHVEYVK